MNPAELMKWNIREIQEIKYPTTLILRGSRTAIDCSDTIYNWRRPRNYEPLFTPHNLCGRTLTYRFFIPNSPSNILKFYYPKKNKLEKIHFKLCTLLANLSKNVNVFETEINT